MAGRAAQLRRASRFAIDLYGGRARGAIDAHVRANEFARLRTTAGRLDPYPVYDRIRATGPFVVTPRGDLATADYAVCEEVLRHRRFGTSPERADRGDPAFDRSLLTLNPPDHDRLRRMVAPGLGGRRTSHLGVAVDRAVARLLDEAEAKDGFDLMTSLARPLPVAVINSLLGLEAEHGAALATYGATLGEAAEGFTSLRQAQRVAVAAKALTRGFEEVLERRRREPGGEDLISVLLAAEGEGEAQVRPDELLPLCRMLLIAGFETTVNLLGNAVNALLDHPEQWEALVADPGLAGAVVQETLRFESPVQRTGRIAFDDTEIAGQPVRAGQWVNVLIGGANRDPAVFTDPDRFDIFRTDAASHLAFGSGIHRCLGRPVAELEAVVALQQLVDRMPGLHRTGAVRRRSASLTRGLINLPVAP